MTTLDTTTNKPMNVIEQLKAYITERTNRREEIKHQIEALSSELKAINAELDGEKQDAKNIVSMMVQTRKRRADKGPVQIDPETNQPIPKKRGRKTNAEKAAEAAAATKQ